jgi:hypothetical protein
MSVVQRIVTGCRGDGGKLKASRGSGVGAVLCLAALLLAAGGCATPESQSRVATRPFAFATDTFAFPNELVWVYFHDSKGQWTSREREPKPDYYHHCFVVARAARQFFYAARFDTNLPVADEETYRRLVRKVVDANPRKIRADKDRVVIPGFPDLRSFSMARESLLKSECGSAWESYFQRGHWRMVFPFSRGHQAATAEELVQAIEKNEAPVIHLARFPQLTINHAALVFECKEEPGQIQFTIYDPNYPAAPATLTFDKTNRRFTMPGNTYFEGGRVDIYQVYHRWCY